MAFIMKYLYKYLIRPVLYFGLVFPLYYGFGALAYVLYFLWTLKRLDCVDWTFSEDATDLPSHTDTTGETYFWYCRYNTAWDAFIKRKTYRRYRAKKALPSDMEYVLRP